MSQPEPRQPAVGEPAARVRWALRVLVVVPIVVAVVRALAHGWFPVGDNSLLAIRAADVGTSHHPLLGSWTSASLALGIDVNNPGPLYSDLVAPFMWTLGRAFGSGAGTAVGVGAINAASALAIVATAVRIGGWRAERWMLVLVAALTWSMGSELLIDIWQPHAMLLPFCLLLVLTVAVVVGDWRVLPAWAAVMSIVIETYVGYAYAVVALTATVLVAGVVAIARGNPRPGPRALLRLRTLHWTLLVLCVAWVQPVWEQLFGRGEGNLQRLATHAGSGDLTIGAGNAVKIVTAVTALPPFWTRYGYVDSVPSTDLTQTPDGPRLMIAGLPGPALAVVALAVLVGVMVALIVALRRPEQRLARTSLIVALVVLVIAVPGLASQAVTVTGLRSHQVRWLFALSLYVHVSVAWGLVEVFKARAREVGRAVGGRALDLAAIAVVVGLVAANVPFKAHDLGPTADRAAIDTLKRTFDDLSSFDPGVPVVYDVDNVRVYEPFGAAVLMRLRELGVDFRFEDAVMVRQLGEQRRAHGDERIHLRQYERSDALRYTGPGCVLSLRSAVSEVESAEADQLIVAAADDLASGTVAVETAGLPDDVIELVSAALDGDADAAFRVVATDLLPVLVAESRLVPTPPIAAALDARQLIVERVNTTFMVIAIDSARATGRGEEDCDGLG
jgi:hypothetical protein